PLEVGGIGGKVMYAGGGHRLGQFAGGLGGWSGRLGAGERCALGGGGAQGRAHLAIASLVAGMSLELAQRLMGSRRRFPDDG
ncbi:MAG TPA: hypothetical protein PLB90_16805, partial [Opitutaceae bacterium]|nr:hypothetical protein [Opitutaceae bacterium]